MHPYFFESGSAPITHAAHGLGCARFMSRYFNTDFRVAFNRHSNIRILTDITERPDSDGHCPASLRCSALCAMEQILESDCVLFWDRQRLTPVL